MCFFVNRNSVKDFYITISSKQHRTDLDDLTSGLAPGTAETDLAATYRAISSLSPYGRNPRTHSKVQVQQIAQSIREFGFKNPVLIDSEGGIVAGHSRVEAAKLLGYSAAPTVRLDHLSEAQKRAYIIADNKLAENARWDPEVLALELQTLSELDIDFEVEITGFETAEIDILIGSLASEGEDPAADAVPQVDPDLPPVSREGDLWQLGPHRLLCGNATEESAYQRLMADHVAQMVFVDPPYNVPIAGHVSGLVTFPL